MRAIGIIRRVDDLGRIVIPREVRKAMNINVGDPLEIFTGRDGTIILQNSKIAPMSVKNLTKILSARYKQDDEITLDELEELFKK